MEIIGHIYYISGMFVLLRLFYSMRYFRRLGEIEDWIFLQKSVLGKAPGAKEFRSKEEMDLRFSDLSLSVFEMIWACCGLLSGSSHAFALILVIWMASAAVTNRIFFSRIGKIISLLTIILRFSLYLLLMFNHFFLKENAIALIKTICF